MASFSLPTDGNFAQPNSGDTKGNLYATYGIDLESKEGTIRVSEQTKTVLTDADNADFAGYAAAFVQFGGSSGKVFAVSDKAFSADVTALTGTWTEETVGDEPNSGNTIVDAVYFDSLALVSQATSIRSWNGSTWSNNFGSITLTSGTRHLMRVGADGNLYITDTGNKVYRVTPTGTVSTSGNGTLDFSATDLIITCMEPSSNRMWIGTKNNTNGDCFVIEWDMSPSSAAANKLHRVGTSQVSCIAIYNDTPVAVLRNGEVLYYNGTMFVPFPNMSFPTPDNVLMDEDWLHPNGWAIIDNLPHFLVNGQIQGSGAYDTQARSEWNMPSGVWCLDPAIGLYHRFALGSGATTQDDYGMAAISDVGALYALQDNSSKFLCSYQYFTDDGTTQRSVLAYHDLSNSRPSRGHVVTPMLQGFREMWNMVEMYHKKLVSGERIRVYYRYENESPVVLQGTWANTTTFNTVVTGTGIEAGDIVFIKQGVGGGQWIKVDEVSTSSTVTSLVLAEANSFATAGDKGVLEVFKFRFMGEINDTTQDYHSFNIPGEKRSRKMQFLLAFSQNASNRMEIDNVIIST